MANHTKGFLKSHLKQEILKTFLSGIQSDKTALYFGLSLLDDISKKSEYRNTQREYENNVWGSLTVLLKMDSTMDVLPVVPRNNYNDVKSALTPEIEFVTNEDDHQNIRLYRRKSGFEIKNSIEKPRHNSGIQKYSDNIEWEFIATYTEEETKKLWTNLHCTISHQINIEKNINSLEYIFYSVDYPSDEIPVLANSVSLLYNPLDNQNRLIKDDFIWYCHRVNLDNTIKNGSFVLRSNPNITGIIKQYDTSGYGYIISDSHFPGAITGTLDFSGESYPITSFIRSKVKRMSGYTLFTQKFKDIYCNGRIKLVVSIRE